MCLVRLQKKQLPFFLSLKILRTELNLLKKNYLPKNFFCCFSFLITLKKNLTFSFTTIRHMYVDLQFCAGVGVQEGVNPGLLGGRAACGLGIWITDHPRY